MRLVWALCRARHKAHARRKFFDLARLNKAPIAIEAVARIDALFAVERDINGLSPEERRKVRQQRSRPRVGALGTWLREQHARLSPHGKVAKAIAYSLNAWDALVRFLDDGRLCMTNNAAERALRGIATRGSLCTPSSSICKHWKRAVVGSATRGPLSGNRRFHRVRRQIGHFDLEGRA
ncbi:MAG: transposase [Rhodospirillales bacterium]|nr:transposase [Rhodospirillales bacterium]